MNRTAFLFATALVIVTGAIGATPPQALAGYSCKISGYYPDYKYAGISGLASHRKSLSKACEKARKKCEKARKKGYKKGQLGRGVKCIRKVW